MPYNLRKRKEPPVEEKPIERPAKKPVRKVVEKPVKKPAEKQPEQPVEKQPEEPAEKQPEEPAEKAAEKPDVKSVKKLAAKSSEEPAKKQTKRTIKKADAETIKQVDDKPEVKIETELTKKQVEKRVEKLAEKHAEKVIEKPAEKVVEKPAEKQVEKPVEKPAEIPSGPVKKQKNEGCNQLVFGSDVGGELGLGKIGCERKKPTPVALKQQVKQVACGSMHTVSLTDSGQVYSYGCNDDGALGRITDGDELLEATPTLVELKDKVTKITAGDSHCVALTDNEEVYIWGNLRDENGMVGLFPDAEGKATLMPTIVNIDKRLKDIASGANHILLLDVDGVVHSFGVGDHGQLGRLMPEECSKKLNAETKELFLKPQPVDLKNVDPQRPFVCDAIFAGEYTSFATNTDKKKNRLAGWGLNNYYQLGYKGQKGQLDQHYPRRVTFTCSTSMINVAGGQHHTIFLTKSGRVYAAGRNEYGMLGIGKSMQDKKEICPAKQVEGFENPIKTISSGSRTSFAVDSSGKLYCWGMSSPNMGVGGEDDLLEPTLVKSLVGRSVLAVSTGSSVTSVLVD